jgi:hypothetical protein
LYGSFFYESGHTYQSGIVLLQSSLDVVSEIVFRKGLSFDTGQISAFSSTDKKTDFLAARTLLRYHLAFLRSEGDGAALDIIEIR